MRRRWWITSSDEPLSPREGPVGGDPSLTGGGLDIAVGDKAAGGVVPAIAVLRGPEGGPGVLGEVGVDTPP